MSQKYEVTVNSTVLRADGIEWDYPQTDGEGSGATDENTMFREVLPERDILKLTFEKGLTEAEVRTILEIRRLPQCSVNFYDLRTGSRRTVTAYPVSDAIKAASLIDGQFVVEPFELRFIQTIPD